MNAESLISSVSTSSSTPEEILEHLNKIGIEWHITAEGTLMLKYWQVGPEDFVSPEHAARIRSVIDSPDVKTELDWLSAHLDELCQRYGGQWIAIHNNAVVASATELPQLMPQIEDYPSPFVTFIPDEPIIWTFTYVQ